MAEMERFELSRRFEPTYRISSVVRLMAEKEGFEPSNTLWVLHDFQSCALGRTTRLLRVQNNIQMFSLCIIIHFSAKVKTFL